MTIVGSRLRVISFKDLEAYEEAEFSPELYEKSPDQIQNQI
jgi:hypothetical protein